MEVWVKLVNRAALSVDCKVFCWAEKLYQKLLQLCAENFYIEYILQTFFCKPLKFVFLYKKNTSRKKSCSLCKKLHSSRVFLRIVDRSHHVAKTKKKRLWRSCSIDQTSNFMIKAKKWLLKLKELR